MDYSTQDVMNRCRLDFHHLGLAVRQPEKAKQFLSFLGYHIGQPVYDPLQKTHLIMCTGDHGMPDAEIIYPGEEPGPLQALLEGRNELIYHICYQTDDVEGSVNRIRDCGIRASLVSPPKPAVLFEGRKVSFYMVAGFGLIELLENTAVHDEQRTSYNA
jgi:methylmalonyl-CoA/ethylmalonyl-CoA epimerase